ncbi:trypsin-like serine peptidase [Halogeometricum borinquense]|nr:trypsin-like peptidase domain-containing protein [Halogeometricum borinquense]
MMANNIPESDRPMLADEFVELDNEPEQIDPEALATLREPTLYLSSLTEQQRSEFATERVEELSIRETEFENVARVDLDEDMAVGRIGQAGEAVDPPNRKAGFEHEFDPYLPDDDGMRYHPKIGTPRSHEPLRRRDGESVTPHYVLGSDDRQVFVPDGYPWRCIGKIYAWTDPSGGPAWSGTGALVGRNVVLTASHVVPWDSDPWMMRFVPAYWDGSSRLGGSVDSYVQAYRGYENHSQGDDMAVLKLYTPLGDTFGYFGYKTYHDSWEDGDYWTKVGYPGAVASGQRPSRVTWYPIIDDDNDGAGVELEYRADSSGGGSGGPVFGWWSGSPYVVGTHSGGEEEYHFPWKIAKHNVSAGGGSLSNLIGWGRSNW